MKLPDDKDNNIDDKPGETSNPTLLCRIDKIDMKKHLLQNPIIKSDSKKSEVKDQNPIIKSDSKKSEVKDQNPIIKTDSKKSEVNDQNPNIKTDSKKSEVKDQNPIIKTDSKKSHDTIKDKNNKNTH